MAADPDPDSELLEAVRNGPDRERAFDLLYRRYRRRVDGFFQSKGYETEERKDLNQETFLRVHNGMASFEGDTCAALGGWIHRIAFNLHVSKLRHDHATRRAAREIPLDKAFPEEEAPRDASAADPLEELLQEERRKFLRQELRDLPPQARRVAELRYVQGRSVNEIALAMNLEKGTVKAHLHQARKRILGRVSR